MNNIKQNDYFNVIIQALAHIPPLRDFLMLEDLSQKTELVRRFSVLVRKIWNIRAFKTHVSPHELLQQVSRQSNKRYDLLYQSDPVEFLSWFLNNLHLALGGSKTKPGTSIVHKIFQGKLKVESQQITAKADVGDRLRFEEAAEVVIDTIRYLMLTLDLPSAPLFQDELDKNIIPQVIPPPPLHPSHLLNPNNSPMLDSPHVHSLQIRRSQISRTPQHAQTLPAPASPPPLPSLPHQTLLQKQIRVRAQPHHRDLPRPLPRHVSLRRAQPLPTSPWRPHLVRSCRQRDARGSPHTGRQRRRGSGEESMESAGQGPRPGRMAGSARFVRREGSYGNIIHQGKLSDGLGEEKRKGGAEVKSRR